MIGMDYKEIGENKLGLLHWLSLVNNTVSLLTANNRSKRRGRE